MTPSVSTRRWLLLLLFALASFLFCLHTGSVSLQWRELWSCLNDACSQQMQWQLLWQLRLPRLLLGFVAGAGLALSGALLQHLSRNPLADPYLFGVIAGAGLGATIATIYLPASVIALPLAAFIGAVFAIALVVALALIGRWQRLEHFILAGVAISFLFSAATALLLYQHDPFAANRVMFWLMGSLSRASYQPLWFIVPCLLLCLLLAVLFRRQLDAMLWSDQTALSLGVPVQPLRLLFLLLTAALTATIVAYCGGIGFVGLMVPHLVRMLLGAQALSLFVGSALCGGIFLIWVDAGARTLMPSQELPLGVITSACGSLFFLLLLSRRRG